MEEDLDLYEVLQVTKDATESELKKSYRKLAKTFHPDRNPATADKFKEISFAYDVLSHPEKRRVYDRHGLKGLQEGSDHPVDANDYFKNWFPFAECENMRNKRPCCPDVVVHLELTLEEIFNGNEHKTITYRRQECCTGCDGQGGPPEAQEKCAACNGEGVIYSDQVCGSCCGRGTVTNESMKCELCKGSGLVEGEVSRPVLIERGVSHLRRIPYPAEGHQNARGERGCLVVVIIQKKHSVFCRSSNDLYINHATISMTEALCGLRYCFTHLDDRVLCLTSEPGKVIRDGDIRQVKGEGMPLHRYPTERGDLFIQFHVDFPPDHFATPAQLRLIESFLPGREEFKMPKGAELVDMVEPTPYGAEPSAQAQEELDFEAGMKFETVQCQTS